MNWIISAPLVLLTIIFVVACQLILKWRAGFHGLQAANNDLIPYLRSMLLDAWIWMAFCLAGLAAIAWMLVLRRADLSLAYPMLALVFLAIPISAFFVFSEPLPAIRILGLALIALGVILVSQSS